MSGEFRDCDDCFSDALERKALDEARTLLDQLPEPLTVDKQQLKINLHLASGEPGKSAGPDGTPAVKDGEQPHHAAEQFNGSQLEAGAARAG